MARMRPQAKIALVTGLSIMIGLVTIVVAIVLMAGGSFTTSWGEEIEGRDRYVSIDGQTLTQNDLEHIAKLRNLTYLRLTNCNVSECRLPELKFASRELYSVDFSGTKGLWDISFLKKVKTDELNLSGCPGVSDLTQLNWDELSELNVDGTEVSDLSPVAGSRLRRLSFAHTNVSDLSPLARAEGLWDVDGSYTQVTSLEPLLSMEDLWGISFAGCPIRKVERSFSSDFLREVNLAETSIKDFGFLSICGELRELNLEGCTQLSDFSWLNPQCRETLERINLGRCTKLKASDVSWLRACTALEELTVDGIALDDLSFCEGLGSLKSLSALGCGLTKIEGLKGCTGLEKILLGYNELTSAEGLPKSSSEWPRMVLDLSHNQIASLTGLPKTGYSCIMLQGNGAGVARTLPDGVETYNVVTDWFSGIEDSCLLDYTRFSRLYVLDCPEAEIEGLLDGFSSWRISTVNEEELLQLLADDGFDYRLNTDMSGYVAFACEIEGLSPDLENENEGQSSEIEGLSPDFAPQSGD